MSACPSLASTQDHSFTIIPIFLRLDAPASVQFTMVGDKAINPYLERLGTDGPTKKDDFLEKFQGGGGSFPIQKFMLQIFAIINGSSVMYSGKKP